MPSPHSRGTVLCVIMLRITLKQKSGFKRELQAEVLYYMSATFLIVQLSAKQPTKRLFPRFPMYLHFLYSCVLCSSVREGSLVGGYLSSCTCHLPRIALQKKRRIIVHDNCCWGRICDNSHGIDFSIELQYEWFYEQIYLFKYWNPILCLTL